MEPLLLAGDLARIFPIDILQIGDIALIELKCKKCALHRLVSVDGASFVFKGDFSGRFEAVEKNDIVGIAKLFALSGRGWVCDPRGRNEILELVKLSIRIENKHRSDEAKSLRDSIWMANHMTRQAMIKKLEKADEQDGL